MIMITTAELLTNAAEAETNAAAQDTEAAAMLRAIEREHSALTYARADLKRAHRKATRLDRPNRHAQGREEERKITEERIPAIEARLADWQAEYDHCTADAARLRQVAADYRAQAGLATIDLPTPFCDWLDGTGLALGHDDTDPECKETREAYDAGTHHDTHTTVTATPTVLRLLAEYADNCIDANADDYDREEAARTESAAATTVAQRVTAARRTVKAAQAQQGPQEAPTAPAAPEDAPTGPVLADWERDLIAMADTLPTVDREPSADLNIAQGDDPQGPQDAPAADIVVPVGTTVTVTQRGQEFTGIVETAGQLRAATTAHARQGIRTHRVGIRIPGRVGFIWADSHETTPTA
jgi:hypothetical protein